MKPGIDRPSRKSILAIALVALGGALLAAAIVLWKKDPGATAESPHAGQESQAHAADHAGEEGLVPLTERQIRAAGITLAKAAPAQIGNVVQLPGEVRFNDDRTAHIVPRVPGVAESVSAELGQAVRKGQVLAVISSPELSDLRSASLAAQKRLGLARVTYEREKKLWEDRISAEQDYLQAQQALREAEIQAQSARSKLAALGAADSEATLNRYVLRAPFDGVIVDKHIAQGEAVKDDANVFLLTDLSSVWVEVAVTPTDLEHVRVGALATVKSTAGGYSASGRVSYVGNLLGEQTRTAKARVVIGNPELAWRPGLFVNVEMARGRKDVAVAVQSDAIQTIAGRTVVFVRVEQGFKVHPVTIGASDGRLAEIVGGLPAGAVYATSGSFVVKAEQGKGSAAHED